MSLVSPFQIQRLEQRIVLGIENVLCDRAQLGKNISCVGTVMATCQSGAKLTNGLQQVDVVRTHKILGQIDDCAHQRSLTVMVGRLFTNGTSKLCHLKTITRKNKYILNIEQSGCRKLIKQ